MGLPSPVYPGAILGRPVMHLVKKYNNQIKPGRSINLIICFIRMLDIGVTNRRCITFYYKEQSTHFPAIIFAINYFKFIKFITISIMHHKNKKISFCNAFFTTANKIAKLKNINKSITKRPKQTKVDVDFW